MDSSEKLPEKIGQPEELYRDAYQKLYKVHADFQGFSKDYVVVDRGQCAAAVVVQGGDVLLVRQYRFVVNRVTFEIPSGKVDAGENPKTAAIRECTEETGIAPLDAKPLISYHIAADTFHLPTFIFSSDHFTGQPKTSALWLPLQKCMDMIAAGEIIDSLTIIGLSAYERSSR